MKQALIDSRDLRRASMEKGCTAMTGNTYCGNLLWQSSLTLLPHGDCLIDLGIAGYQVFSPPECVKSIEESDAYYNQCSEKLSEGISSCVSALFTAVGAAVGTSAGAAAAGAGTLGAAAPAGGAAGGLIGGAIGWGTSRILNWLLGGVWNGLGKLTCDRPPVDPCCGDKK